MSKQNELTKMQVTFLVILRILIGWHFLFEGLTKLFNPGWTSMGYLMDSGGFMAGVFQWMATNDTILQAVDFMNAWGLTLVGAGLILGIFTRLAAIGGIILLLLYYLSHPPLIGVEYILPSDGSYWLVNKTLIELFMLAVLIVFRTGQYYGIDKLIFKKS